MIPIKSMLIMMTLIRLVVMMPLSRLMVMMPLTILKLARDLQQVLSSQDPLTPWHLHSTFMFRSSS